MIASDYETRLIDRIAVRQAAATLKPRERRVLTRYYGHDETLQEVAQREGVTKELIRGIRNKAECKLRARIEAEPLKPTTQRSPPPSFDRAGFLRHMQGLIVQREALARERRIAEREAKEAYERDLFTRERRSLDAIMRSEEAQGLFDPPAPPKFKPPPYVPPPYVPPRPFQPLIYDVPHVPVASPHQTVEPWFDPAKMPTPSDLRCIAQYALGYLGAIRPQRPSAPGLPWRPSTLGTHAAHVISARDADAIATAMQSLSRAMPASAQLSIFLMAVPEDLLGASLATAVGAMRVVSMAEGKQVSIEVTYD